MHHRSWRFRRLWGALLAGLAVASPHLAFAQGSTVYQNGTAIANHLAKFVTNGRIADVGGILGDAAGYGVAPFAIYDNGKLGLCSYNLSTLDTAASSICLGHTATGGAQISVTGDECVLNFNGVAFPCVPGEVSGMASVADNTTLKATSTSGKAYVMRMDFVVGSGAAPLIYAASASPCTLNAGAGDNGSQVKSSDNKCWLAMFPPGPGSIGPEEYGADRTGVVDAAPAFMAACAAAPGRTINVAAGTYFWDTAATFTTPCLFVGAGWNERNNNPGMAKQGTWIKISNTGISPITFSGVTQAGAGGFVKVAFEQTHPVPGPTWAPTAYPPVITITGTAGEAILDTVYFYNIYAGVLADGAAGALGRIRMDHIRGQVFTYVFKGSNILDTLRFDDWHIWPFWSNSTDVMEWTQANGDVIQLARTDGLLGGRIFALGYRTCLLLTSDSYGFPTEIHLGELYCDLSKFGVHVVPGTFGSNQATFSVGTLIHNATRAASGTGAITGSWAVQLDAQSSRGYIGRLVEQIAGGGAVNITNQSGYIRLDVGSSAVTNWNQDNNDSAAFQSVSTAIGIQNRIELATTPLTFGTSNNNGPVANAGCNIVSHVPICGPSTTVENNNAAVITNVRQRWTPQWAGQTVFGTPGTNTNSGTFYISGNSVEIAAQLNSTLTGASGNLIITGFPFLTTGEASGAGSVVMYAGLTLGAGYTSLSAFMPLGSSVIELNRNGSGVDGNQLPASSVGGAGAAATVVGVIRLP